MTSNTDTNLPACALEVAHYGDRPRAQRILLVYGDYKVWSDETRRARWDGAASLLTWWHEQDETLRPPLDNLSAVDAQGYLGWLEAQGLARSTIQGYRSGAQALTKALQGMRTLPIKFDASYDPFAGAKLSALKARSYCFKRGARELTFTVDESEARAASSPPELGAKRS